MWFEILPSAIIITGAMIVPALTQYGCNWLFNGNPYRRNLTERWERTMYLRDTRIAGDPYTYKGLEALDSEKDAEN